jgi:hypothetical protein
MLGFIFPGQAAVVLRWRIRPVEVGSQRRAGGEEKGKESGTGETATGGHGGLGGVGRAGIAAIIRGGCARPPEPLP